VSDGWGGARPGAGRPAEPDELRKKQRKISMSDLEWAQIQHAARAAGVSVSEYIRRRCLPEQPGRK
jgi:ActR/RegA family two-component response regulator